ncbi:hypothetical protein GQ43DRAFT_489024 [Delitschia confertaspora ATCC 74209]|uniref:Uncharacterized protein n=1 Tax=Delitschia confertaspora ATCC 74209 TaxID=1513339 RepID=A0A9P4MPF6_9PLEO|nr:hypothetical protein GQ43DRAFT_489024 [Delitschia confertaspora ATCC 74209]
MIMLNMADAEMENAPTSKHTPTPKTARPAPPTQPPFHKITARDHAIKDLMLKVIARRIAGDASENPFIKPSPKSLTNQLASGNKIGNEMELSERKPLKEQARAYKAKYKSYPTARQILEHMQYLYDQDYAFPEIRGVYDENFKFHAAGVMKLVLSREWLREWLDFYAGEYGA